MFEYDTNTFLAQIDSDAPVRGQADITARVEAPGLSSVLRLKNSETVSVIINEIAEIDRARAEVFTTKGAGTVFVDVVNPSTVEAGTIDVEVSLDNGMVFTESMLLGKSVSGKPAVKSNFPVTLTNMDPLRLIKDNGISGTVSTKLTSGAEIHAKNFSISIDRNQELAKYYHQVVNNETNNFGDQDKQSRLEALAGKILELTQRDISNEVDWDDERERKSTVLAKLVKVYRSAKISGNVKEEAQLVYNELANELNAVYDRVGDYDGYLSLLNELSSAELEERGKKDRK